ncbi:MAG: GWxTD domain-containing protein [Candidatus Krumholzibacteria bacterium]|nr:GWxTD domain-containing protein [Candidatus Krumholzibacteria bacterium]
MNRILKIHLLILLFIIGSAGNSAGQAFRGSGDFEFFLDAGSLPQRNGQVIEFFQIAIPTKEIEYSEKDGSYKAAVSIYLLLTLGEDRIYEKKLMINDSRETPPSATDLTGFIYIADSVRVSPGSYLLSARVEDLNRDKKTLMGMLRKKHDSSTFENEVLEIAGFQQDRLILSEPFLLWGKKPDGQYIPNPIQIYGLKNDTLSFFAQAMLPEDSDATTLDLFMSVFDQKGERIDSVETACRVNGGKAFIFGVFDVNAYPAGAYRLAIEAAGNGELYALVGKDFSVVWELMNWKRPRRDVLVEARIIFNDTEYEEFRYAGIGQQEKILNDFWKKNDPTPHTALNETFETFMRRVSQADVSFGDHRRGAATDRGQIYIRFGPPDELVSETIPFNRTDLDEVVNKLDDQYRVVIHNTWKGLGTQDAQLYNTTMSRNQPYRGGGMDTGGYELWVYVIKGAPLFPRDKLMTIQAGMRFLFVDKDGVGNYLLVGTSEEFEDSY